MSLRLAIVPRARATDEHPFNDNVEGYKLLLLTNRDAARAPGCKVQPIMPRGEESQHTLFRLINIMFSEKMFPRLRERNDQPTRLELERQSVNKYWADVTIEFETNSEDYNVHIMQRPDYSKFNPSVRSAIPAKRLHQLWKELERRYTDTVTRSKASGQHADFSVVAGGQKAVMYLHDWDSHRQFILSEHSSQQVPNAARRSSLDRPSHQAPKRQRTTEPTNSGDTVDTLLQSISADREAIKSLLATVQEASSRLLSMHATSPADSSAQQRIALLQAKRSTSS